MILCPCSRDNQKRCKEPGLGNQEDLGERSTNLPFTKLSKHRGQLVTTVLSHSVSLS